MKSEHKRAISLDSDVFNVEIDDCLYAALISLTTYHPNEEMLYLSKQTFIDNKEIFFAIIDAPKNRTSANKKLNRHLDKLINNGLCYWDRPFALYGDDKEVLVFPKVDTVFELVDTELLMYLAMHMRKHILQIYVYLVHRSKLKQGYEFSYKELAEAIGWKYYTGSVSEIIGGSIDLLVRLGLLRFTVIPKTTEHAKTFYKRIDYISTKLPEIAEMEHYYKD